MVGEVFNEEDDENDSDEDDLQMKALEKRQASVAIVVDDGESPPNNKLNTSDISGGMVKVGNGSNYSDNHSMDGDFERQGSIISGGVAEAETDHMSGNMLNASIDDEQDHEAAA